MQEGDPLHLCMNGHKSWSQQQIATTECGKGPKKPNKSTENWTSISATAQVSD